MAATDPRIWAKITVDFFRNRKVVVLSDAAKLALLEMILWSRETMTDGVIPARVMAALWHYREHAVEQAVQHGVEHGVEHPVVELLNNDPDTPSLTHTENGDYLIHDFLDFQESRAQIEASRARKSAAGQRSAAARRARREHTVEHGEQQPVEHAVEQAVQHGVEHESNREEKRREEKITTPKGVVGALSAPTTPKPVEKPKRARGTHLPDDWEPALDLAEYESDLPLDQRHRQIDIFRDYWKAATGARATKRDWEATWRNWLRSARPQPVGYTPRPNPVQAMWQATLPTTDPNNPVAF